MATAEQLRAIRKKAGIGEFAPSKTSGNASPSSPKPRRRVRPRKDWEDVKAGRFNYSTSSFLD